VPVHDPSQDPLHPAVQSAVVETAVHVAVQWSLQHALHEDSQSVEAEAVDPSGPEEAKADAEQEELHPGSHREVQSVVQLHCLLPAHVEAQARRQVDSQVASAEALHCELHCCSSLLAQTFSQLSGAHCVEQLFCATRTQFAFASMSTAPQAEMLAALAVRGSAERAARAMTMDADWSQRCVDVFIPDTNCNSRTTDDEWSRHRNRETRARWHIAASGGRQHVRARPKARRRLPPSGKHVTCRWCPGTGRRWSTRLLAMGPPLTLIAPGAQRRARAVVREHRRPRARPLLVRRLRDDRVVGRHVAQRGARHVDGRALTPERFQQTWSIPVCVRYASGKGARRACTLLTGEQATIPIDAPSCPAWVIGNADGLGYHVACTPAALVASGDLLLGDVLQFVPATAASPERHVAPPSHRPLARRGGGRRRVAARASRRCSGSEVKY
jgi:hypothetical protein